jgi:hypothetical protein
VVLVKVTFDSRTLAPPSSQSGMEPLKMLMLKKARSYIDVTEENEWEYHLTQPEAPEPLPV